MSNGARFNIDDIRSRGGLTVSKVGEHHGKLVCLSAVDVAVLFLMTKYENQLDAGIKQELLTLEIDVYCSPFLIPKHEKQLHDAGI
ncbi:hypothetical protein KY290_026769 [Solanum tuberosum]|uniref:Uncharacterized protein n=1 Tax=Solanum tuberosum TaxID=4113 RepID=A0ABQ7UXH5_SOLTU|nr:hypothetical protein KY289_024839 [Solanum tuberosum]KAH0756499.1 hypothetical protein KY290_026769 [Solanum tuberosum]